MNEEHREQEQGLDQFFQSRLSSDKVEQEGWNTPPDYIWEEAMEDIHGGLERKRRWMILWLIISTLSLSGVSFFLFYSWQMRKMDHKIESIIQNQKQSIELKSNKGTEENSMVNSGKEITESTIDQDQHELVSSQIKTPLVDAETEQSQSTIELQILKAGPEMDPQPDIRTNKRIINDQNSGNKELQQDNIETNNDKVDLEKMVDDYHARNKPKPDLVEISPGDTSGPEPANDDLPLEMEMELVSGPSKWLFVTAGANFSKMTMSSIVTLPDKLKKYDEWYTGYQAGFGLRQTIGKSPFSWDAGFGYKTIRNKSVFKDEASYDKSNEDVGDNGELLYTTELPFASPVGNYSRQLITEVEPGKLTDGAQLDEVTWISNRFHIVQLNLGLNYSFYQGKKVDMFAKTMIRGNYVMGMRQDADLELYRLGEMLSSDHFSNFSKEQINQWYTSGAIGLGFSYKLKKNGFISWENDLETGFQSLRKVVGADQVKTHVHTINSVLVLGFIF